jgi:oligogalacturonide lyase
MAKGRVYPSESGTRADSRTGARIRQITNHPSIHHHPFYYVPAYDDAMHMLYFVSHRTGTPQIFCEVRESGKLVQLTERSDLNEWSVHPSHDGRFVYFTAGARAWRLDTETLKEECLADFGAPMKERGMVGAAMGTTTLSRDDRWWAIPVKTGGRSRFVIINTMTGRHDVILERDTIGHPQFHPDDADWLRYAGPYHSRIWIIRRDGSDHRLVYRRDEAKKEWIVHETWRPGTREILTTNWPHGVLAIHADTGAIRYVARFNAWHPMINREGTTMVADTKHPDIGLQVFEVGTAISAPRTLCYPEASNAGDHWNTDHCPYDDGPVNVHAPQHTHPHPNFSPQGTLVVFTSDCTSASQVYEVDLHSAGG